ncbi:hypothetical protein NMG60_11003307 [Bertholletia excelsa]
MEGPNINFSFIFFSCSPPPCPPRRALIPFPPSSITDDPLLLQRNRRQTADSSPSSLCFLFPCSVRAFCRASLLPCFAGFPRQVLIPLELIGHVRLSSIQERSNAPRTAPVLFPTGDKFPRAQVNVKLGCYMAEEAQAEAARKGPNKRRMGHKKGGKAKKKLKMFHRTGDNVKIDKKMQKLFRKRARDYNSDDDEEPTSVPRDVNEQSEKEEFDGKSSDEEVEERRNNGEGNEVSEDEDGEIQPGIAKFSEGCKAFRMAFKKITKTNTPDELLGPVLSAHKKLLAEKFAEEEAERKVKGEAKKEKHLVKEKGHVKPANFLDSHEKFLIGVATKGVVKLFNAVNKAQNAQKGLNPSRSKDAKAISKRKKEAFFTELVKTSSQAAESLAKAPTSASTVEGEGPAWAPLRDSYMLTNPKLKDWDKMMDSGVADDIGRISDSSSGSDDD